MAKEILHIALPSIPPNNPKKMNKFQRPWPQEFPLPFPIIKHFFTNPSSPKGWKKLIQTCKYSFFKNPVFPVENIKLFSPKSVPLKIWLYGKLEAYLVNSNSVNSLMPKLNKCDLRHLHIYGQNLTFEEYQFLTSSGNFDKLYLWKNKITKKSDGKMVTCDKLLENIYRVDNLELNGENCLFETDTVKKLVEILSRFKTMGYCNLYDLPENFDFSSVMPFIMKNERIKDLHFNYKGGPLPDDYRKVLEECIDKINANPPKNIPRIWFAGFGGQRYKIYYNLLNPAS